MNNTADIISPNEAKFWQEKADGASVLMRERLEKQGSGMMLYKVGGVVLGVALGMAAFTKNVPSKWKIATGAAAAISLLGAAGVASMERSRDDIKTIFLNFADMLEKQPQMRAALADHLQQSVTAEDIQKHGLDNAVAVHSAEFAMGVFMHSAERHAARLGSAMGAAYSR